MRSFILLASIYSLCWPLSAHAGFVQILPGTIERVVATGDRIAVLRGGTVFILGEDGRLVGRFAKPGGEGKAAGAPGAKQAAEHILDLLDIAEIDRDTDYADDLVDDEQSLAGRRHARAHASHALSPPETPPALAASGGDIWIAGPRGLFRVGVDGIPVRESGRESWRGPLAASGQALLATQADSLALLASPDAPPRLIPSRGHAHAVALSESGRRQAWATPTEISWTSNSTGRQSSTPAGAVTDLTFCGETLVALLADSLLVVPPDGPPETRARDLHARRLICPQGLAMPWLAVGEGLLVSADRGRHWKAIATPAGVALLDIAASTHHVWLATNEGLLASTDGEAPASPARQSGHRAHAVRRSSAWLSWMPKVSVRAAANFSPGEHRLEALAFAAFPLNGRSIPLFSATLPEDAGQVQESPPAMNQPARHAERAVDLRDPDADCLRVARRKAVELAMAEPERARSYVTRSGHTAWLPELRVLVSRRYGRSESLDINSSSTALSSPLGIDTVNDIRYEARATWDLGKLVFSSEELAAQTQAMHMAELRRDIETTMNRLYFERRGLMLNSSESREEIVRHHVRAAEVAAELSAMSAGAFAKCVSGDSAEAAGAAGAAGE